MTIKKDTTHHSNDSDAPKLRALAFICFCIIGLWLSSWFLINHYFSGDERGVVGDTFGAVNALFSGLAFSVLIYTMFLQRSELKLQREELRDTRAELAGQKEQMEIQNSTMRRQRFEQTFFSLLDTFSSLINAMEVREGGRIEAVAVGRSAFFIHLGRILNAKRNANDDIQVGMKTYMTSFGSELSNYISMIEVIVQFVEAGDLTDDEKRTYVGFMSSTFSTHEKVVLFYIGLSIEGQDRIKWAIEKYNLLTDLYGNHYIPENLFGHYAPTALCRPPKVTAVA